MLDDKNDLLNDGIDTGKKVLSAYEKTQKIALYVSIAKFSVIGILLGLVAWGGFALVSGARDMLTEAVVSEAKDTATKKAAELKAAVKKKTDGHTTQSLSGAFVKFVKRVETNIDEAADGVLVENGFHPDAPNYCAFKSQAEASGCIDYTETELSASKYDWIKVHWTNNCPDVYARAMDRLKFNGKITYNDKRLLDVECNLVIEGNDADRLQQIKADLLKGDY